MANLSEIILHYADIKNHNHFCKSCIQLNTHKGKSDLVDPL